MPHFSPFLDPIQPQKSFLLLLDQCTTLPQLEQIQASLTTSGLIQTHTFLNSKLVDILTTRLRSFPHALQLLSTSHFHSCFPYNTLIRAFSLSPTPRSALHLFGKMLHPNSPSPNSSSFTFALKACARSHAHRAARAVHALAITAGYESSSHVANTALHAYALCGDIASARKLFDAIPLCDTIKWNAMISGYVQNGLSSEALELFGRMWAAGVVPTDVTVVTMLSGCAQTKSLSLGRQIHGLVSKKRMQLEREINVGTALLDMYAKCGYLDLARKVFDAMKSKDTGAWKALIGGFFSNGYFREALHPLIIYSCQD